MVAVTPHGEPTDALAAELGAPPRPDGDGPDRVGAGEPRDPDAATVLRPQPHLGPPDPVDERQRHAGVDAAGDVTRPVLDPFDRPGVVPVERRRRPVGRIPVLGEDPQGRRCRARRGVIGGRHGLVADGTPWVSQSRGRPVVTVALATRPGRPGGLGC